ncbi:hypothetical protein AGOR_G00249110 [Albula goreensis]|uniref:FAM194 C-terminal domain-containing protein n=1 Tax=Albula goreensis TaxID=1534307 RepID=A0A8T3CBV4_9TELE|nr:hypothetical protein AGOR_G00249110 [Albula goreensis]
MRKKSVSDGELAGDDDLLSGEGTWKGERKGRRDASNEMNYHGTADSDVEKCTEASPPAAHQEEISEVSSLLEDYQHAAKQLLLELEEMLRRCQGREEGYFPGGLRNVLNYTWRELTEGAVRYHKRQVPVHKVVKHRKSKGSVSSGKASVDIPQEKTTNVKKKSKNKTGVVEKTIEKSHQESTNLRIKPNVTNGYRAPVSTTISFSISSEMRQEKGWIVQSEDLAVDDPQWMAICRWAVERLQLAQISIKKQNARLADQGFTHPLLLRHYGDAKTEGADKQNRQGSQACPFTLCHSGPPIPVTREEEASLQKLHYRTNDGSAFIYYPSGHIAVCHSYSGLPCGGFYTNVFDDTPESSVLATFTPYGHGTVTNPLSGTVTVWDQCGGMVYDPDGTVTWEWAWSAETRQNKPIIIEVTELITVRVWSATSATLRFRSNQERVQLPLSFLPNATPPKDLWVGRSSDVVLEGCHKEVECVQEVPGKKGWANQDLRKLQRTVRNILEGWLKHYRQATGIDCPVTHRLKDARHTLSKRKAQSAAVLLSLSSAEVEDTNTFQPPGGNVEQLASHRQAKEKHHIAETGALRVHSNIRLDPVVMERSPEMRHRPAPLPSSPCPVLVRAALQGGEESRQCRCSNRRMPLLTDLEYDAFIRSQGSRSQQILVVCVTPAVPPPAVHAGDDLDQLYRRRNQNRTMPCTQCHPDSFRLVRYEIPTSDSPTGTHNALLQQRNNIAPGMFLMYIGGKLLFADHIFNGYSCSVRDLQKQIAKTWELYHQGQSLPTDFRFSPQVTVPPVKRASTAPHGLKIKSIMGTEHCAPQGLLLSEKRITQPVTGLKHLRLQLYPSP